MILSKPTDLFSGKISDDCLIFFSCSDWWE